METSEKVIIAKFEKVLPGKHDSPYYVTRVVSGSRIKGSITFGPKDWKDDDEKKPPEESDEGCHLIIDNLVYKNNGWRAKYVRYFRPEDAEDKKF